MNSFTVYEEYFDLITLLPKKEQAELVLAIFYYMFLDEYPNLNEKQMKVFVNLKRPLDISKKRSAIGSISKSNKNQNEIKTKSNKNQKENKRKAHQDIYVYVNDNVNVLNNLEKIEYEEEKPLKEIVEYLNLKTNSNYRVSSSKTKALINARLNEGYTLNDFKNVIDKKTEEWIGTDMEKYLRPETLFGTKFESYLNQKGKRLPTWLNDSVKKKPVSNEELEDLKETFKEFQ